MSRVSLSLFVVAFTVFGVLTLTGCGTAQQEPIKVGYVGPVTGTSAWLAEAETAGAKLAVEEVNKAGGVLGRQVELQVEDTGGTNAGAVAATTKLVDGGRAVAIIGHLRSPNVLAASENILKGKIPVLTGATAVQVTHQDNPYIFRTRANDDTVTQVAVDFFLNQLKFNKIAILHDSDSFGAGGAKGIKDALAKHKLEPTTVQTWTTGAKDYTAQWLNIQKSGAQAVAIWLADPQDGALLLRQKNELGIKLPALGSGGFTLDSTRESAGEHIVGMYAVADWSPELATPEIKSLMERFKVKYGKEPDYLSMMSYDQVQLVINAIKSVGAADREKIKEALSKVKGYDGYTTYNFDKYGDGVHQGVVVQIEKDRLKGLGVVKVEMPN